MIYPKAHLICPRDPTLQPASDWRTLDEILLQLVLVFDIIDANEIGGNSIRLLLCSST